MQEFSPWCSLTCHHPRTEECFWNERERRVSWQGERRARKYFMIWDFIQSRIPDLSPDARVILRKALSIKDGILFFQPLRPKLPHLLAQLQSALSPSLTPSTSPLSPFSVCRPVILSSLSICHYLACAVANLGLMLIWSCNTWTDCSSFTSLSFFLNPVHCWWILKENPNTKSV